MPRHEAVVDYGHLIRDTAHNRAPGFPLRSPSRNDDSRVDPEFRDLYLQICYREGDAVHWLLVMKCPGASRGYRLHSTGFPGGRELSIEPDMRFDSRSVEYTHYLGRIHSCERSIVISEAKKVPLQSCQLWSCYLMYRLEGLGLLKGGTYDHYMYDYYHRKTEDFGKGNDP
jgi:hypothetical protein